VLVKNEVALVHCRGQRLQAEVLRIRGRHADLQVFEDTVGVGVGDEVELTGRPLSATLGPGLLGKVFDGLQNPLASLAEIHGFFLPRGTALEPLDAARMWKLTPRVGAGQTVHAGDTLGVVPEGSVDHHVMVPADLAGPAQVEAVAEGSVTVGAEVARLVDADGRRHSISLRRQWPVRIPFGQGLLDERITERLYPGAPLFTGVRIVDAFFPIALGGTACIPGPFGAGKTVLQNLLARFSLVDVVVIIACGERAAEVVELIAQFPQLVDPRGGQSLMERTVIICNTSAMPVVSRESSLYLGITIAEYYRAMGLQVLTIADSTSRWAQAMREISGRMEEIPGEEAFPAYLDSSIRSVYERAGVIRRRDGAVGSLTLIGTVSPAGGNFEEPVTQSTLGAAKVFLGLSAERAYRRAYPAIDPLQSWTRYREQLAPWFEERFGPAWNRRIAALQELLRRGDAVAQMMEVAGEEGISPDDYVLMQKSQLLDRVFLQQDAYDPVDVSTPIERQHALLELLWNAFERKFDFTEREQAREFFARLGVSFRALNSSVWDSPDYRQQHEQIVHQLERIEGTP
jgi:V/A-type H+-transporting ATPase subunit A